jgi:hypothetical protein
MSHDRISFIERSDAQFDNVNAQMVVEAIEVIQPTGLEQFSQERERAAQDDRDKPERDYGKGKHQEFNMLFHNVT